MTLTAPNVTYSEDFYVFHWPDMGLEAIVERLVEEKSDIRVELTVRSDHPTHGGRLYSGRLLLFGPNSRRDVRKELEERGLDIDWSGILEQVCLLSRERFRSGEPVVDLYNVPKGERAKFLREPFIIERGITILYGDGATAKSNLALRWALETSLNSGCVLYLDWEDDATTHAERLRALSSGMNVEDVGHGVFYQRRAARLSESVRDVRRIIAEKAIVLVIVDSLGMAAGDPNNHDLMIEAVRACRQLGVAVLAIHHLPKNTVDKSKPFGSVYASNEARLTWLIEKAQEEDTLEFTVLLSNQKSNRSKLFGKRAFKLCFESEGDELVKLSITDADATEVEAFRSKLPLWKHVAFVLERHKLTVVEINKALAADGRDKVKEDNIRRAINEHKDTFINVGSSGQAVWALRTERTSPYEGVNADAYAYAR